MAAEVSGIAPSFPRNLVTAEFWGNQRNNITTFCGNNKQALAWTAIVATVTVVTALFFAAVRKVYTTQINPPANLHNADRFFVQGSGITAKATVAIPQLAEEKDGHDAEAKAEIDAAPVVANTADAEEVQVNGPQARLPLDLAKMNTRVVALQKMIDPAFTEIKDSLRDKDGEKVRYNRLTDLVGHSVFTNVMLPFLTALNEVKADNTPYDAVKWNHLMKKHCSTWDDNKVLAFGELLYDLHTNVEIQEKAAKAERYLQGSLELGSQMMRVNPIDKRNGGEKFAAAVSTGATTVVGVVAGWFTRKPQVKADETQ